MIKNEDLIKLTYQEQVEYKKTFLQAIYPTSKIDAFLQADNPLYYRHKVIATFGYNKRKEIVLGQYIEGTHKISEGDDFLLQNEVANKILKQLLVLVRRMKISPYNEDRGSGYLRHVYIRIAYASKKAMVVLVLGKTFLPGSKELVKNLMAEVPNITTVILNYNPFHTSVVLADKYHTLIGKGYLLDELLGLTFKLSPQSFYQVNPKQTEKLYQKAIELAHLNKNDVVLDACCGIGTIALLVSKYVKRVVGVEINKTAILDAKRNAQINEINNVNFICCDIANLKDKNNTKYDVVFVDPPRQGCQKKFLKYLSDLKAKKIIYISCNPLTQKRDSKVLEKEGYVVKKIVGVDMFPNTIHVECIVMMSRK